MKRPACALLKRPATTAKVVRGEEKSGSKRGGAHPNNEQSKADVERHRRSAIEKAEQGEADDLVHVSGFTLAIECQSEWIKSLKYRRSETIDIKKYDEAVSTLLQVDIGGITTKERSFQIIVEYESTRVYFGCSAQR